MLAPKRILFERLTGTRIVAKPDALEAVVWPEDRLALRLAPDELYVTPPAGREEETAVLARDPHAIIMPEGAFSGAWVAEETALAVLERTAEWELPAVRPAFAQGAVAGVATKLWLTDGRVLFIVPAPYAHELEERLA